jgi:AraC-like DNA-binding protein
VDVLSEILGAVNLAGSLYFTTEFTAPWGVSIPRQGNVARFHLVMRGVCWVGVEGDGARERMESGDLVLVPHGAAHILADPPDAPCIEVDEVVRRSGFTGRGALVYGGEDRGHPTRLLCGHFQLGDDRRHPLLERLPGRIIVRRDEGAGVATDDLVRLAVREVREAKPGADAVVRRLSEILFIRAVRAWAERPEHDRGVLAALADPSLARGLDAFHRDPGREWTLARLAREAGLSRTVFAERFHRSVGLTPMQYAAFWRTQCARRLLLESALAIDDVARRVGYRSPAAFSRVFRRWAGESPARFRRRGRPVAD